jgi:guanylate kinase
MKNLFLIDGASGTGKSDLLRWVMDNNANDVGLVRKGTTRKARPYEEADPEILLDLEFLSESDFDACGYEYTYTYGGARYGLSRAELTGALLRRENVFVIVRNTATISNIAKDYELINVVKVFIYTDRTELTSRLHGMGTSAEIIEYRLKRSDIALRDYYSHPGVFDETIINNSSHDVFHNTINMLIAKYQDAPSINPYLVSVMMSFNPSNKKLDDYYDAMDAAVQGISRKYMCKRVDKIPGSPKIAAEFRGLIASSRCVIVDLTENKQNVYYELGYIQAARKTCVITAEAGTQPFFYPREHKIIFYASARELRDTLRAELAGLLDGWPSPTVG